MVKPARRVELQASGRRSGAKRTKIYFGPHTLPKKGVVRLLSVNSYAAGLDVV